MINQLIPRSNGDYAAATPAMQPKANLDLTVKQDSDSKVVIPGNFDMFPIPPAMTQVITSATGSGALSKTIYFGNESVFNATPTNNGSGADSITNTYGDGFSGKSYNQLFAQPTVNSTGLKCYGFTLQYITTNGGAQNPSGLTTANPTLLVATGTSSNMIPRGIVLSAGARNTQYLSGVMTVQYQFTINSVTQFSYIVPAGSTSTLTILTAPF